MNTAKESFIKNLLNPDQFTLVNLFAIFGVVVAVVPLFFNLPLMTAIAISVGILLGVILMIVAAWQWNQWRKEKVLEQNLPTFYPKAVIRFSTQYYLRPYCSEKDPSDLDAKGLKNHPKTKVFKTFDHYLSGDTVDRFITLLGGSGTGKTSFVLNYFALNQRRLRKQGRTMKVIPLGTPDVDAQIAEIENKKLTILFLDGFDENVDAFKRPVERLMELWKQCEEFNKVIITSRTQFFTEDKNIPRITNIPYYGPKSANMPSNYRNTILYLLPFENWQVRRYIWRRFHYWKLLNIRKAFKIKDKIPTLSIRPMLLAYIPDLIEDKDVKNRDYRNSFEIYEKMVDAWMKREEGILENTSIANLQEFSERLAVDLYTKSEQRSAARIHHEELEPLAQRWEIDLNKFQISSRSLLNRDALGYYKFAHRTFMEFLFMQRFLKWDPQTLKSPWNAQIQTFFKEAILLLREWGELLPFSLQGVKIDENEIKEPVKLRATPLNPFEEAQVVEMIKKENFFDENKNKTGKGFIHDYQIYIKKGEKVVIDYRTNLMWQQSGSQESGYYEKAQTYIKHLNDSKFAGYDNWRLPTLEEAMSLMEREKKNADLYIDPMFDTKQRYIWTADRYSASGAWNVVFDLGYCNHIGVDILDIFARAVRS